MAMRVYRYPMATVWISNGSGSSLYFTTGDHGAYLSQQDGNNELACKLQ